MLRCEIWLNGMPFLIGNWCYNVYQGFKQKSRMILCHFWPMFSISKVLQQWSISLQLNNYGPINVFKIPHIHCIRHYLTKKSDVNFFNVHACVFPTKFWRPSRYVTRKKYACTKKSVRKALMKLTAGKQFCV